MIDIIGHLSVEGRFPFQVKRLDLETLEENLHQIIVVIPGMGQRNMPSHKVAVANE